MARIFIEARGVVTWVCVECGVAGNRPLGEVMGACCKEPKLVDRCYAAIAFTLGSSTSLEPWEETWRVIGAAEYWIEVPTARECHRNQAYAEAFLLHQQTKVFGPKSVVKIVGV